MTRREKILAAVVAAIVGVFGLMWGFSTLSNAYSSRNDDKASAETELEEKQSKVRRGKIAMGRLKNWEKYSLPSDVNIAQTQYRVWLHELLTKSGLTAQVIPAGDRAYGKVYVQHSFRVTGQAELSKLLNFLHQFYSTGYIHRISSLNLRPITDKKELEMALAIEVVALNQAPPDKEGPPPPAENPPQKPPEQYASTIVTRNIFSAGNNPPRIESIATQRGNPNRPLTFSIKANDPDKLDKLTYALESAPGLEGAKVDPKTGEFQWTPSKLGEKYEATIRVTDDGTPPKSTTQTIQIAVVDPPPAPPPESPFLKDDPARDAKVTATVASADRLQVWVTVPRGLGDQPKTLHLNSGDSISVGSFVGVVKAIREREAEFELKDGRTVVVRLDQPLVSDERRKAG